MNIMKIMAHGTFIIVVLLIIGFSFAIALSDNSITLSPKNKDNSKRVSVTDQSVIPVNDCMVLDKPYRTYRQVGNIVSHGTGSCIKITAQGITFDGQGFAIQGNDWIQYGIYTSKPNTNIKNVNINLPHASEGIFVENTTTATIQNVRVKTGYRGITFQNVFNSLIEDSFVSDNAIDGYFYGISLIKGGQNTITNNKIMNNSANYPYAGGFFLSETQNNVLKDNQVSGLTLTPGPVPGFAYGVYLSKSENNLFVNTILEDIKEELGGAGAGIGISLEESSSNNKFLNTISQRNAFGIVLGGGSGTIKSNSFIGGLIDSNSVGISIYSSESNIISGIDVLNSYTNAIVLGNFISNNTLSQMHVSGTQDKDLFVYNYQNNGTMLNDVVIDSYSFFFSGAPISTKNANGEIKFLQSLSGTGSNFMNEIKIEQNKATIDASSNPGFDKPAQITLNSISLPYEPQSIRIMRNNQLCSSCNLISWNPQQMQAIFNVLGQGVYSIA